MQFKQIVTLHHDLNARTNKSLATA